MLLTNWWATKPLLNKNVLKPKPYTIRCVHDLYILEHAWSLYVPILDHLSYILDKAKYILLFRHEQLTVDMQYILPKLLTKCAPKHAELDDSSCYYSIVLKGQSWIRSMNVNVRRCESVEPLINLRFGKGWLRDE